MNKSKVFAYVLGPAVEVANAVPSLERRSTIGGRLEDSAYRNGSLDTDATHLFKVDEAGPSSGPKFAAVENSENGNCTDGDLHASLTNLDEVVNAGSSLEQSSGCEIVENNGSFHNDTGVPHWDEAVNESEVSNSYIVNDGDNQLVRSIMKEELSVILEKTCEREYEPEFGQNASILSNASEKKGKNDQDHIDAELKASVLCDKISGIVGDEQAPFAASPSINGKDGFPGRLNNPDHEWKVLDCSNANDLDLLPQDSNCKIDECIGGVFVAELVLPSAQGQMADAEECNLQSDLHGNFPVTDCEELRAAGSLNLATKKENSVVETGSVDDDFTKYGTFAQSGQICSTDFLDEIIEDAKNNKVPLFFNII